MSESMDSPDTGQTSERPSAGSDSEVTERPDITNNKDTGSAPSDSGSKGTGRPNIGGGVIADVQDQSFARTTDDAGVDTRLPEGDAQTVREPVSGAEGGERPQRKLSDEERHRRSTKADLDDAVGFHLGRSDVDAEERAKFERIFDNNENAFRDENNQIVITGTASRPGSEADNLELSRQRAEAVKDLLMEQGIDESRIEIVALGEIHEGIELPGSEEKDNPYHRIARIEIEAGSEAQPEPDSEPSRDIHSSEDGREPTKPTDGEIPDVDPPDFPPPETIIIEPPPGVDDKDSILDGILDKAKDFLSEIFSPSMGAIKDAADKLMRETIDQVPELSAGGTLIAGTIFFAGGAAAEGAEAGTYVGGTVYLATNDGLIDLDTALKLNYLSEESYVRLVELQEDLRDLEQLASINVNIEGQATDIWQQEKLGNLSPTERGREFEELLKEGEYRKADGWTDLDTEEPIWARNKEGFHERVDFLKERTLVSLKTLNPFRDAYKSDKAIIARVKEYVEPLKEISGPGVEHIILDLRIPRGTIERFDPSALEALKEGSLTPISIRINTIGRYEE